MVKKVLFAIALWVVTVAAGTASIGFGEFGTSAWIMVLLLLWLATLGAPTSAAVLVVTWAWPGGSFPAFAALATGTALMAQICAVWLVARLWKRLRTRTQRVNHPT